MTNRTLLLWIERGFLALGLTLAVWCAFVLVDAHRVQNMPVPAPTAASTTLPGETPALGPTGRIAETAGTAGTTGSAPTAGSTAGRARAVVDTGSWVARLDAPSVKMSATVLEGSDDRTLSRGAGHIEDTPFPGEAGNIGIAGHRDTTFRPVRNLHVGDPLVLTTAERVYKYRITKTIIVDPEDVYVLDPADHQTLTLVTCYPFEYVGHAPRRFIVSADLVQEEARTAGTGGEASRPLDAAQGTRSQEAQGGPLDGARGGQAK